MSQPECLVPDLGGGRHRAGPDDPQTPLPEFLKPRQEECRQVVALPLATPGKEGQRFGEKDSHGGARPT